MKLYFSDASGLPLFELDRKQNEATAFVYLLGSSYQPIATILN